MQTENKEIVTERAMMGPFPTMDFMNKELGYITGSRICLAQVTNPKDIETAEKALNAKELEILRSMKGCLVSIVEYYKSQDFNFIDRMSSGAEKNLEIVNARLEQMNKIPVEFEKLPEVNLTRKSISMKDLAKGIKLGLALVSYTKQK